MRTVRLYAKNVLIPPDVVPLFYQRLEFGRTRHAFLFLERCSSRKVRSFLPEVLGGFLGVQSFGP